MSYASATLDLPARPGLHPKIPRRRSTLRRQTVMAAVFLVLVSIICGYWVLTDSNRVRDMAEAYLSRIIGGRVHIGKASLSLFEGLRLDRVTVYVGDPAKPDSKLFSAKAFLVRTNLRALLSGQLEATQIMALDPQVRLCEDLDKAGEERWNYQRLSRHQNATTTGPSIGRPTVLPEILLRAGLIEYSRVVRGQYELLGSMAVDGQLSPLQSNRYAFDLDSRAPGEPSGPRLKGVLDMDRTAVSATLQNFEFNSNIRTMLPSQVQAWWAAHQLAGRIRIPVFEYEPGKKDEKPRFRVEVEADGIRLAILPSELLGRGEYERMLVVRPGIPAAGLAEYGLVGRSADIDRIMPPRPIMLQKASGRFVFTPDQVRIVGITGRVENNTISITGALQGYDLDAPMSVSLTGNNIIIPRYPRYLSSLPRQVRKIYSDFQPEGRGFIDFRFVRDKSGGPIEATGEVSIVDGSFCFDEFLYPLRHVTGQIKLGRGARKPDGDYEDKVEIVNFRGLGREGTINADRIVTINGNVTPLDRGQVQLTVHARDIQLDEHVRRALPPEAREAIAMFDVHPRSPITGMPDRDLPAEKPVQIQGGFEARIFRPAGQKQKVRVEVDLAVQRAIGEFFAFPYPLRNTSGSVKVRPNQTEVDIVESLGDARIAVNGRIEYGKNKPVNPILKVSATAVPVDERLLSALGRQQRQWLTRIGVGGNLDVEGNVFLAGKTDGEAKLQPSKDKGPDVDFDLKIKLRDGVAWPINKVFAITSATADLNLTRDRLTINKVTGRRGVGNLVGDGVVSWPKDDPVFNLNAAITDVPLDDILYNMIPAGARRAWDELRPEPGSTVDLHINYRGGGDDGVKSAVASIADAPPASAAAPAETYEVIIQPRKLALNPVLFPWRMYSTDGTVVVTPEKIQLDKLTAQHGKAKLTMNGIGTDGPSWDLHITGENMVVDDDLRKALPEGLRSLVEGIKLGGGPIAFDCPEFTYRTVPAGSVVPAATQPAKEVSKVDFNARLTLADGKMDLGIPLTEIGATMDLSSVVIDGSLHSMTAEVNAPSLAIVGQPMRNLRTMVYKPAGKDFYIFDKIRAKIAGGDLAGRCEMDVPKEGSATYGLRLALKDLNVRELVGDEIKGRLDASLDVSGNWSDPGSRMGRGDILVQGRELYHIPVVFGLLQIANLSLPIKSPFNEATASYMVAGQKVTFEKIELRSASMLMQGAGSLDFGSKKVQMTFVTDNPGFKIPIIGDFIDVARHELLQIHVLGTIEEPTVKAKSFNTFTTTVDEVFKGNPKQQKRTAKAD